MAERILLVDAITDDVELIQIALLRAGVTNPIDIVRSGEEAFDYLYKRGKYADRAGLYPLVILLDLKLPGVDGKEVLKQLKSTPLLNCIPVVVLTGSLAERDLIASYAYGANSYVVKPVDSQAFFDAIKSVGLYWTATSSPPPVDQCKIF